MKAKQGKLLGAKSTWQALNVVLLVITLGGLAGGVWFGFQWFDGARVGSSQTEPVDAAREVVTKILTVSPGTVDENLADVEELATGDFADEWIEGEKTVKKSVLESGATRKPDILKAGYLKGDSDSATVILAADTRTTFKNKIDDSKDKGKKKDDKKKKQDGDKDGDGIPDPRTDHFRIKVNMALVDGTWKIAKMEMAQ